MGFHLNYLALRMALPRLLPTVSPTPHDAAAPAGQLPAVVASGQFNVYAREQFSMRKLTFGRRDYYKVALITGSSRYNYATRGVLIDRPALVFSNPLIPYSWEPVSAEQGGYLCMFTEEFLLPDRSASLQESPLFRLGSDPVYFVEEAQYTDLAHLFGKMLREMQSGYRHQQEVVRNYLNLVIHEALKMQPQATYYQHPNAASRIVALFQGLLERQFPIDSPDHGLKLRTPADFARQLSVHVNHLNRARAHAHRQAHERAHRRAHHRRGQGPFCSTPTGAPPKLPTGWASTTPPTSTTSSRSKPAPRLRRCAPCLARSTPICRRWFECLTHSFESRYGAALGGRTFVLFNQRISTPPP